MQVEDEVEVAVQPPLPRARPVVRLAQRRPVDGLVGAAREAGVRWAVVDAPVGSETVPVPAPPPGRPPASPGSEARLVQWHGPALEGEGPERPRGRPGLRGFGHLGRPVRPLAGRGAPPVLPGHRRGLAPPVAADEDGALATAGAEWDVEETCDDAAPAPVGPVLPAAGAVGRDAVDVPAVEEAPPAGEGPGGPSRDEGRPPAAGLGVRAGEPTG